VDTLFSAEIYQFEKFRLDQRGGGLFRLDEFGTFLPVGIGSRALAMLGVLVARAGDVVTRQEILDAVWPSTAVEESNLTVQLSALRRILDAERISGSCIQTVPGRGYRFVLPVLRPDEPAGRLAPERVTCPHVEPDVTAPALGANAVEPPKSPSRSSGRKRATRRQKSSSRATSAARCRYLASATASWRA
jgi:DNA-binding winged helix-turn-helix (wHTH) protein